MLNYLQTIPSPEKINLIFRSLSDPTRRGILERLATKNLTVSEIAQAYDMSLPAISQHLKILEHAQLISRKKTGREYHIRLEPETLQTGAYYFSFYKKFWETRLNNLEKILNDANEK